MYMCVCVNQVIGKDEYNRWSDVKFPERYENPSQKIIILELKNTRSESKNSLDGIASIFGHCRMKGTECGNIKTTLYDM